jgi:hypothetical protein
MFDNITTSERKVRWGTSTAVEKYDTLPECKKGSAQCCGRDSASSTRIHIPFSRYKQVEATIKLFSESFDVMLKLLQLNWSSIDL